MTEKVAKQAISARIHPANYQWLKRAAEQQERSANWLLDKLLTEARVQGDGIANAGIQ